MWIENQDPEKHPCIISRCYTKSENQDPYPLVVIDVDRVEYTNELEAHILTCVDDNLNWEGLDEEPDWIVAEKNEMLNIAKDMIRKDV